MPSKTTSARLGAKGATTMVRHPLLRRATVRAAKPSVKLGWRVGKIFARRKAQSQFGGFAGVGRTVGSAGRTAGSAAIIYVPMAADVLGLTPTPKPKRRLPAFAAGIAIGAGVAYLAFGRDST
ncbi:MAG: hypothetical protein WAL63_20415 [Solirubrobacteraceae bacterium]